MARSHAPASSVTALSPSTSRCSTRSARGREQGALAGEEAVQRGAGDAGPVGQLVHAERPQALGADHLDRGGEDAVTGPRLGGHGERREQGFARLEVPVEARPRDAGGAGEILHGGLAVTRQDRGRAIEDASADGHEPRLDKTSRLVKYRVKSGHSRISGRGGPSPEN